MCEVTDIVHKFGALKAHYIDTMDENSALKKNVELLTKRLETKENHRLRLIALVKEHTEKYRKRARSLEEQNNQLETLVQEQRQSIHEYSRRMVVLESTLAEQSSEIETYLATINRLNKEVASLKNQVKDTNNNNNNNNSVLNVSNQSIKKNSSAAALKLDHPSFCTDSKEPLKKRRKSKAQIQKEARRWSNLNISISGSKVGKDIGNNSSSSESDLSSSREKRRKLYHIDDDTTIDLSNEKD